jgi:hypothetical protein
MDRRRDYGNHDCDRYPGWSQEAWCEAAGCLIQRTADFEFPKRWFDHRFLYLNQVLKDASKWHELSEVDHGPDRCSGSAMLADR